MIPITIDSTDLIDLGFTKDMVNQMGDYVVKEITAAFAKEWEIQAATHLGSTREEYIMNLKILDEGVGRGAVMLTGWLPNAIEEGWPSFDMKTGLLSGPNAKIGNDGTRYNTVPFRWAAPTSIGESGVFSGKLPVEVHQVVKNRPTTIPVAGGGKKSVPLTVRDLPAGHNSPKTVSVPKVEAKSWKEMYTHKSPLQEGLSKYKDSVTGQNTYKTFRRVSENSDPSAWIHPGFEPHKLAELALAEMDLDTLAENAITAFIEGKGW